MTSALVSRAPLCIALAVAPAAVAAAAQYPVRPVRFIVPAAPGATNDLLARVMGQKLSEQLGQQFVVDNRPGAAGAIGTDILAKSPPDGHTIGMIFTSHTTNAVLRKLPYDPVRDIAPVTMLTSAPLVLVIHPALGVNSVRELVALAKTKPLINEGSEIVGSAPAAFAEFIKQDIARWTKVVKAAGIKAE